MPKIIFVLLLAAPFLFPQKLFATTDPNNAGYTNICGRGYQVNSSAALCSRGCDANSKSCAAPSATVVEYTCQGRVGECRSNESNFSQSHSVDGASCGQTVQIDVFSKNCRASNGNWQCGDSDLLDYIVWYTGDCHRPTPSPSTVPAPTHFPTPIYQPPPTSTPITNYYNYYKPRFYQPIANYAHNPLSCNGITITSGAYSFAPATVTLQVDSQGSSSRNFHWDFGDGTSVDTNSTNVSHTYQNPGRYVVKVDYVGDNGQWQSSGNCERTVIIKGDGVAYNYPQEEPQRAIYAAAPMATSPATKAQYLDSQPKTGTGSIISFLGIISGGVSLSGIGLFLKNKFFHS